MKLLIIGCGPSADTPEVARVMADPSITVMRINLGVMSGRYISGRCDIWGTSLEPLWPEPVPRPAKIWWTSHPFSSLFCYRYKGANYEDIVEAHRGQFDVACPKELKLRLSAEFCPKEPSTGNVLIAMALADPMIEKPIVIAGFSDGFDTNNQAGMHYYTRWADDTVETQLQLEAPRWHDFEKERAFRQHHIADGMCVEIA